MNKNEFLHLTTAAIVVTASASQMASLSSIYATNVVVFDNSSQEKFVFSMAPYAQKIAEENDMYASIMIAQATLESGYGRSDLAVYANNLFGVKAKPGDAFYEISSLEFDKEKNEFVPVVSSFKKFETQLESLRYYTQHFTQSAWYTNYYKGVHRSESSSYKEALQVLDGKYATDPNYIVKLQTLIDRYNLTQFDAPSGLEGEPTITEPEEDEPVIIEPVDTTAPNEVSTPKTTVSVDTITVSFVKPSDTDYSHAEILRNGVVIHDKLTGTSFVDTSLAENTKYTYVIKTVDQTGNKSAGMTLTAVTNKTLIDGVKYHTVKSGENRSSIGQLYNITSDQITEWNGLESNILFSGQTLIVSEPPQLKYGNRTLYAERNNAKAYSSKDKKSHVVKTFAIGEPIVAGYDGNNWYYGVINGKQVYFHEEDVMGSPLLRYGNRTLYTERNNAKAYSSKDKNSNVIKTFTIGEPIVVSYEGNNWYYGVINGKQAYFHEEDVASLRVGNRTLYAERNNAKAYSSKDKNSNVIKTFAIGEPIVAGYEGNNWYYGVVNGKQVYFHEEDVMGAPLLRYGNRTLYAERNNAKAYSSKDKNSVVIRTYAYGETIVASYEGNNWYYGVVNGKQVYFHEEDVMGSKPLVSVNSKEVTHLVQKGDTLWNISTKYGVTTSQIKSWNNLKDDTVKIGQTLIVKK